MGDEAYKYDYHTCGKQKMVESKKWIDCDANAGMERQAFLLCTMQAT
jgi:hypothetical protein